MLPAEYAVGRLPEHARHHVSCDRILPRRSGPPSVPALTRTSSPRRCRSTASRGTPRHSRLRAPLLPPARRYVRHRVRLRDSHVRRFDGADVYATLGAAGDLSNLGIGFPSAWSRTRRAAPSGHRRRHGSDTGSTETRRPQLLYGSGANLCQSPGLLHAAARRRRGRWAPLGPRSPTRVYGVCATESSHAIMLWTFAALWKHTESMYLMLLRHSRGTPRPVFDGSHHVAAPAVDARDRSLDGLRTRLEEPSSGGDRTRSWCECPIRVVGRLAGRIRR